MQLTSRGDAVAIRILADRAGSLPGCFRSAGCETIEIAVHQLRDPALRYVARKR